MNFCAKFQIWSGLAIVGMRGSTQKEALATRSVKKHLEIIFSIVTPHYWCQNDRTDEVFQMVRCLTRSDTIMMELTRI